MTEREWLDCSDPRTMLAFLRGKASDRNLRLFAVACCRQVWHLIGENESRRAVEVAEQFADGIATLNDLAVAYDEAYDTIFSLRDTAYAEAAAYAACQAAAAELNVSSLAH